MSEDAASFYGDGGSQPQSASEDCQPQEVVVAAPPHGVLCDSNGPSREEEIRDKLKAPIPAEKLARRAGPGGQNITYMSGDAAFEEANRIFGFDGWASDVDCHIEHCEEDKGFWNVLAVAKAHVWLKDQRENGHREEGNVTLRGKDKLECLARARKAACTDAKKRTLRIFGDALGNMCYSKEKVRDAYREASRAAGKPTHDKPPPPRPVAAGGNAPPPGVQAAQKKQPVPPPAGVPARPARASDSSGRESAASVAAMPPRNPPGGGGGQDDAFQAKTTNTSNVVPYHHQQPPPRPPPSAHGPAKRPPSQHDAHFDVNGFFDDIDVDAVPAKKHCPALHRA